MGELGALEAAGSDYLLGVQAVLDGQVADGVRPPTALKGGPLAVNAPGRVLRGAGVDSTLHGFRSSARSWMAESGVPAEVAEACLAHVPRSRVVQAYQRSDLLERRAEVLQAWCEYISSAVPPWVPTGAA